MLASYSPLYRNRKKGEIADARVHHNWVDEAESPSNGESSGAKSKLDDVPYARRWAFPMLGMPKVALCRDGKEASICETCMVGEFVWTTSTFDCLVPYVDGMDSLPAIAET